MLLGASSVIMGQSLGAHTEERLDNGVHGLWGTKSPHGSSGSTTELTRAVHPSEASEERNLHLYNGDPRCPRKEPRERHRDAGSPRSMLALHRAKAPRVGEILRKTGLSQGCD